MAMSARTSRAAGLAVAVVLTVMAPLAWSAPPASAADPNPIVVENRHPGTAAWQIEQVSDDGHQQVKGYASAVSVDLGESVTFFVTVNPVQDYSIDVYRFGYYRGLGGRLMQHVDPRPGITQPSCPMDRSTGAIACAWSPSYTLDVPTTWTSGVYLAKLTNAEGFENYIVFVVRDDRRASALLYQQSVTTYQAYNNYPDDGPAEGSVPASGKSLYDYNSSATPTGVGTQRAVKVSYDRPYSDTSGNGEGAGDFLDWESYYVRWLEARGYDVAYTTDVDVDQDGGQLLRHRGFLSVGHDEYWSAAMYDAAEDARDQGVGLGFFGANAVYWQIRFEPSVEGNPHRVQVCYKDATLDPVKGATATVNWRDPLVNRPEQQLIGVMFSGQQPGGAPPAPFVATSTSHWVYAGTDVEEDEPIATVVGYETDRYHSEYAGPAARSGTYSTLSSSPYVNVDGVLDHQQSSIYQAPSGAWVFAAGTIEWSWGLYDDEDNDYADPRIQTMTENVLDRMAPGARTGPA